MKRSLESPHRLGPSTQTARTTKRRHHVATRADKAGARTAAEADWTLAPPGREADFRGPLGRKTAERLANPGLRDRAVTRSDGIEDTQRFAPLPRVVGGFPCLVADVPLQFSSNSLARPGRNAMRHYRCSSAEELAALPIDNIAAPNAWLFFGATGPCLPQALSIIAAWRFTYSGSGFVWVKLRRTYDSNQLRLVPIAEADLHIGLGHTTRKNAEFCLLARRGRPQRLAADVREVVLAPVREHSRKPEEVFRRIERLCAGPRIELFARERRLRWISWGDEIGRFDATSVARDDEVLTSTPGSPFVSLETAS
jgi:N6-adenosine-specific RNA methylase IME4